MGQKAISWHQTLFPWGKGGADKVKLFLLLCAMCPILNFCSNDVLELLCWTPLLPQESLLHG